MQHPLIRTLSLAGLLAGLLASPAAAADGGCAGIEPRAGTWLFADDFESGDATAWGGASRFRATRIVDLVLDVRFGAGFSGDHVLHLELRTPKGHHYQTLTAPVATAAARAGTKRAVEGYPRPLAVLVTRPAEGGGETAVSLRLPVAGTSIVSNALYGEWTASARLDDATEPCGPSTRFVLAP